MAAEEGKLSIMQILSEKLKPKFFIQDVPFVYGNEKRKELIEEVLKVEMKSDDVVLCGYPRSGTTWHKTMLWLCLNNADVETASKVPTRDRVLFMEKWLTEPGDKDIRDKINEAKGPRIFFTHLPYDMISPQVKKAGCKVYCCIRNPKDVITSAWYAKDVMQTQVGGNFTELQFQHILMYMMSPHSDGGHLAQHVRDFWVNKNNLDICYIFFEESKEDHAGAIRKMAEFSGKKLTDDQVELIRSTTAFKKMQTTTDANKSVYMDQTKHKFIRKGEIGDWKNHFTVAQSQMFDQFMAKEFKGLEIPFRFQ